MRFLFSVFVLFLLAACKPIEPLAPNQRVLEKPIENPITSSVAIPIEIDLKKQLKQVESSLPKMFDGKEEQCEGISFAYKFVREPIDFTFKPNELYYEVDGKFELKLNYCPKCHELWDGGSCTIPRVYASCGVGEPMRRVKVGYGTRIDISSNYKFQSKTELKKFEILDPCKITVFSYDATSEVKKQVKMQLEKLEDEIDKQIEGVDLKAILADVWKELQKPIALDTYGFMYLFPKSMAFSEPTFSKDKVSINLNLGVSPIVSTNTREIKETSLPKLEEYKKKKGFDLSIDIKASYDSLSSILNKQMKGKVLDLKGKKIIVTQLGIDGTQDNKMLFKMSFEGSKKGTLYLTGVPQIDTVKQVLYMDQLDFDLETKSVLLKSAKWLFSDRILSEIKKNAVFEMTPMLEDSRKMISEQLSTNLNEDISMKGIIDVVKIKTVYLSERSIVVRTQLSGDLKLKMK